MIVRKNLKLSVIIRLSGPRVLAAGSWAMLFVILHEVVGLTWLSVPNTAVGPMATALAIFLAFHNNGSYDRWWEARKQWGQLVNSSRSFARQVLTFVEDPSSHRALLHRHIAYVHALRFHLRKQTDHWSELSPFLARAELDEVVKAGNVPLALVQRQAKTLEQLRKAGALSDFRAVQLDQTLTDLMNVQGACERIKNTPLPRQYEFYTRLFVWFFVLILPATMIDALGWRTPLFTVPTSFLFFALEGVAAVNEDPFENRIQDTPLTALCRTIEINLRELGGETDLPPPLQPVDGYLL
ncbi:MAG: bestrophin family ion channel [Myxococcaceae bacterium]|nr:bestrophin family ion channel [Myxococcaceae bacterium]